MSGKIVAFTMFGQPASSRDSEIFRQACQIKTKDGNLVGCIHMIALGSLKVLVIVNIRLGIHDFMPA